MEQYRPTIEKLVLSEYSNLISPSDQLLLDEFRKEPELRQMIDDFRNFILSPGTQAAWKRFEEKNNGFFERLLAKILHKKIKPKQIDIAEPIRGLPIYPN